MKLYEFDSTNPEHLRERAAALEHNGALEYLNNIGKWVPRGLAAREPLDSIRRYRPAREPEIVPYTLETFPLDLLRVKRKDRNGIWTIGNFTDDRVAVSGLGVYTFQVFLEHFTQCDGSPCGTVKI